MTDSDSTVRCVSRLAALGGALLLLGCTSGCDVFRSQSAAQEAPARLAVDPGSPKPAEAPEPGLAAAGQTGSVKVIPGAPPLSTPGYALSYETPEGVQGQASQARLRLVPRDPWHLNLDYPTALRIEAPPNVTLARAEQKKGDAVRFDANGFEFVVPYTASEAGPKRFTGELKFAVCRDEACVPVTEPVEFNLVVR